MATAAVALMPFAEAVAAPLLRLPPPVVSVNSPPVINTSVWASRASPPAVTLMTPDSIKI